MKKFILIISILFAVLMGQAQITADFTWSDPQCSEGTITFTDASIGNPSTSWEWYIGGSLLGNSSTFTETGPNKWFIPRVEKKAKHTHGEVTTGRAMALAEAKITSRKKTANHKKADAWTSKSADDRTRELIAARRK